MFQWDKSINALNIPASKVVHLFRSMREVQLALPGVSSQQASAFLCQYRVENGVATVAVFHLHKNSVLAFYSSDPKVVPEQKMDSTLDQGLNFVESMGFLMSDQDIHLLDEADQEMLWSSLPLKNGVSAEEESPAKAAPKTQEQATEKVAPPPVPEKLSEPPEVKPVTAKPASSKAPETTILSEESLEEVSVVDDELETMPEVELELEEELEPSDNVEDLLAAVEAMRAKRPGLRARKLPPSPEEMERRRQQLVKNVGRILASL